MIRIYKATLFLSALTLSGCMGIYEGGFECPPGEGTKCKSVSEVNELVSKGTIPFSDNEPSSYSCFSDSCSQPLEKEFLKTTPKIWWAPWNLDRSRYSDPSVQKNLGDTSLSSKKEKPYVSI